MLAFAFTGEPPDKQVGLVDTETQSENVGGGGGGGGGGVVPLTLNKVTIEKLPARAVTVIVYPPARNGDALKETLPSAVNWPEPPYILTPV